MKPNPPDANVLPSSLPSPIVSVAVHALFWLVFANAVGVLIAILLLFPALNSLLGEWTYGRWIMVHMNLELYGWTSLPMAGFLFKIYGVDRGSLALWCRPVLWVWSIALGVGTYSWLSGDSSGKLFLDWSGYARILFPLTMFVLWLLLFVAFIREWSGSFDITYASKAARILGLMLLLTIPFAIYLASSPNYYPAINPDTGGPTGASQLESSLIIVAILLMLPFGLTERTAKRSKAIVIAWSIMVAEFLICLALGRSDSSHHHPVQFLSLASLLIWIPLMPSYYDGFQWNGNSRRWRVVFLCWWSVLVLTGWILFLPGVLDHFKFTDGLVGHSFLAMAGFTSSLLIFILVQLLGDYGWIFNRTRSFYGWNLAVLAYVVLMFVAGWHEGFDPTFTIVPGVNRNVLYILRLLVGAVMFAASLDWLLDAVRLLREPVVTTTTQGVSA
jgi:cytochrome c oxidase cbb3-type subunit 1